MVGIVDYGMGNLLSVFHAVEMVGGQARVCSRPEELAEVERIILPGVGAFGDCISNLRQRGFIAALEEHVLRGAKPFFGICLGMQALAKTSSEGGRHEGLGWLEADVVRLQPADPQLRVPHIGWNEVDYLREHPLFAGLPASPDFYFVHSYAMKCTNERNILARCEHGESVTAAVCHNNIFATQFHPEKSQDHGLLLLANFLAWRP